MVVWTRLRSEGNWLAQFYSTNLENLSFREVWNSELEDSDLDIHSSRVIYSELNNDIPDKTWKSLSLWVAGWNKW